MIPYDRGYHDALVWSASRLRAAAADVRRGADVGRELVAASYEAMARTLDEQAIRIATEERTR